MENTCLQATELSGIQSCLWLSNKTEFTNPLIFQLFVPGDFQEVYRARYELARYFQAGGDKWLADHFFETCLQTSGQVTNDGGKMQAEGYSNVALAEEENGKYMYLNYI